VSEGISLASSALEALRALRNQQAMNFSQFVNSQIDLLLYAQEQILPPLGDMGPGPFFEQRDFMQHWTIFKLMSSVNTLMLERDGVYAQLDLHTVDGN